MNNIHKDGLTIQNKIHKSPNRHLNVSSHYQRLNQNHAAAFIPDTKASKSFDRVWCDIYIVRQVDGTMRLFSLKDGLRERVFIYFPLMPLYIWPFNSKPWSIVRAALNIALASSLMCLTNELKVYFWSPIQVWHRK